MDPHARAVDTIDDVDTLEGLDADGFLTEGLREHLRLRKHRLRLIAELDDAMARARSPRRRMGRVEMMRIEPTPGRDEIAITVLQDELGSLLATGPVIVGRSGQGKEAATWVWQPVPALQFVDRAAWARVNKVAGVVLVVLDPRALGKNSDFSDLHALLAASPARVHYVHEAWRSIVRASPLSLVELWAAHPDVRRDRQRNRIVTEALARVREHAEVASE
jgi:hypothetical protein